MEDSIWWENMWDALVRGPAAVSSLPQRQGGHRLSQAPMQVGLELIC